MNTRRYPRTLREAEQAARLYRQAVKPTPRQSASTSPFVGKVDRILIKIGVRS